ncbi:hypothetical protein DUI87_22302 [Hirundo rustica rustica]|uniref:Uncharacterized protein n=1 Tax=Hirundo rustica rustica TaxID=333673 RepID=A0A3M0JIR6_HIRRU|nr:hypothetical protein DUI87_22302 [Hirundo rustica rustica]
MTSDLVSVALPVDVNKGRVNKEYPMHMLQMISGPELGHPDFRDLKPVNPVNIKSHKGLSHLRYDIRKA